jgi:hypothetical protein
MASLLTGSNYPEILGSFLSWSKEARYVGKVELNACVEMGGNRRMMTGDESAMRVRRRSSSLPSIPASLT